jgi:pimeloyl-ACP methyl ester carboxylesterase
MSQKRKGKPFTCTVKEACIAFTDTEKGYPNIVLLHGFLESKEVWKEWSERIPSHYRIVTIDLPGHGASETIGYYHSMELMAEVVHGVLGHIGIRRYFMVGHSMGGYVCLAYANLFSERLKAIALIQSTAFADSEERKKLREKAIKLVKKNHLKYIEATLSSLFTPTFQRKNKSLVQKMVNFANNMSPQAIAACLHGLKDRPSTIAHLQQNPIPCLLLAGEIDKTIPLADLQIQHLQIPNSELQVVPKAGHMAYLEVPDLCFPLFIQFIKSHLNHAHEQR